LRIPSISICVPAYGRPKEFQELLSSIEALNELPEELLICEDGSQERAVLQSNFDSFYTRLQSQHPLNLCKCRFVENAQNFGYDGNVRELLRLASSDYVFFIGNDDALLPGGISETRKFLQHHPVLVASRSFLRFHKHPSQPIGVSRAFRQDTVVHPNNSGAGAVMRLGGFFGGLVFHKAWANSLATTQYDGTMYYQIYLMLHAWAQGFEGIAPGIGYISTPTVAARADNAPLFGNASAEKGVFIPGKYTAVSRGRMWESVLKITSDCQERTDTPMLQSMRRELSGRLSFHLFEMFATRPRHENNQLRAELIRLKLYDSLLPKVAYLLNLSLGSYALFFYKTARRLIQR
jgi:glycosyltransferase involved in cell wall biosynthesis